MNQAKAKPRRRWTRDLVRATFAASVLLLAIFWYVHTDYFRSQVRERLISALQQMTGGRVELQKFNVVPFRLRVEARDLTIHGTEAPEDVPYAHLDHLVAQIKIISLLETEFGFTSLTLEHPVIHLIVYPDGKTNQPTPKISQSPTKTPIEQLFAVSISRLDVVQGELLWNNERIPLDLSAQDVSGELNYSLLHSRYESYVRVGKADTKLRDLRPFSWMATAQFGLGQNYAEISSLVLSSGRSRLEARGRIDDFRKPRLTATYNARLDLPDLGSVWRMPELRGGVMEVGGKGAYSAEDFLTTGKLLINQFEWRDPSLVLRNASLSAEYDVSPKRLTLSDLRARLLGGSAEGDAEILNWRGSAVPPNKAKRRGSDEPRGSVELRVKDISVAALATALTTPRLPLDRLKLAGSAAGSMEAKWKGLPRNADAAFSFNVLPPVAGATGQIPLSATGAGVYRYSGEELQFSAFSVTTRATQIKASGELPSGLKLAISTTDLGEWQPVLDVFRGPQIPVILHGHAAFNGSATGKLWNFMLAGHLQMNDFETAVPVSAAVPERRIPWDSLTADLRVSPRQVSARNGMLARGSTAIAFDVGALLSHGKLIDTSPFTARIHTRNADLGELESLAGYSYPVSGRLNLVLNASGTKLNPHGEGQVQLTNAVIYEAPVSSLTSDLRFEDGEAQLNNILLSYNRAIIRGGASYTRESRAFRFNLSGTNFDLERFPALQSERITIAGTMDFTAQGSGTLDEPIINAGVHFRDLVFDRERAGDFTLQAVTHGANLQLTGRSNFEKAQLMIDGTVQLRNDWPTDLSLHFDHLDVDALLRTYLENHVTGHSSVAGALQLRGPLRQPRELSAAGNLGYVFLDIEHVRVQNEGPVRFDVAKQVLTLEQLRLRGEGTDVAGHGTVQLTGQRNLDLRADGRLNLKLIEGFSPDLTASGMLTVAVNVGGTVSSPGFQGKLEVTNGAISSINLPNGLSNIKGVLVFSQDRLQIQSLTAVIGGGTVNLAGSVIYSPHLSFDVTAQGHDVRLRPEGVSATSNADLHLVGTANDALLSGDVTVVKLGVTPGFDFARYLQAAKQTTTLPQANTILNNVRLDVHVVTTPELQMQSSLGKFSGDADLRLRGTLVRPVVLGRVDIMEGTVNFNGTKYRLERGEITFTGPVGIKPTLDLEAATRVRDYDITLGVTGTPDKLNFTYRSEPPLPSADIIGLLTGVGTQEQSGTLSASSQSAFSQEASNAILSQAINATLSNRSQRLFGISRIKVDPEGLNTETTPTHTAPAVTIEQQVSNNFTLSYTTQVSQTSQQIIQSEYNITRNISILAMRDQNGVISFDVRLRQRRK